MMTTSARCLMFAALVCGLLMTVRAFAAAAGEPVSPPPHPPQDGKIKPGDLTEDQKKQKHKELTKKFKEARKETERAEQRTRLAELQRLEKELGIYDVQTLVDNGDVSKRVDVTIVSAGFPKSDARKVKRMANRLKDGLLKVEPFRNYPAYINFHLVRVDDADASSSRIAIRIDGETLSCDDDTAAEYADYAPDSDLLVVLCNVSDVRSTARGARITIDVSLDMGRTFLHEMGHAFGDLDDEYEDETTAPDFPLFDEDGEVLHPNVTRVSNPKLVKWHYWVPKTWQSAYQKNRLPSGHQVACYEGGYYRAKGVWRPEQNCLMQRGNRYCVVCFEEVEKHFYNLIAPIDAASPRQAMLGLWRDDRVSFEAVAISTVGGRRRIGKFKGFWYVDGESRRPSKVDKQTITLDVSGGELGPGLHEVGLRVDFSNDRVRRDNGFLSSSRGWTLDVYKASRPRITGPERVAAPIGEEAAFDVRVENPDPKVFQFEAKNLPDGASFTDGKFTWTPTKAHQGAWRPRFVLTDGIRSAEKAVEISVSDPDEKNFEPLLEPVAPQSVPEGEKLEVKLNAVDVDGDHLVYSSPNLPVGAHLDPHQGVIRWTPHSDQAGRYEGIVIEVFDGHARITEKIILVVKDRPAEVGEDFAILNGLRSNDSEERLESLQKLKPYARTFRLLEAARLLRDRDYDVRKEALKLLKELMLVDDGRFMTMLVKDLAPHAWHFTDDPEILKWLDELVSRDEGDKPDLKLLNTSLKLIGRYNDARGFPPE